MASTYTSNTGIELIATGEQSGTWGDTTNTNLQIIDRLTNGVGAVALSGTTHTLATTDGVLSDGQFAVLVFGGSPSGTNTVTITPNDQTKQYVVVNNSGQSVILTQGSGGNVTVEDGKSTIVYADGAGAGAAVVDVVDTFDLVLGDVIGPASATDNAVALFDGTTGKLLQDSAAQDGVLHGVTVGRGAQSVATNTVVGAGTGSTFTAGTAHTTLVGSTSGASLSSSEGSTFVGSQAGAATTTADNNTYVGYGAGERTNGARNTALGYFAYNATDVISVASGTGNTAIGASAMAGGGTLSFSVAIGDNAMVGQTGFQQFGDDNVAVGRLALADFLRGDKTTAVGALALQFQHDGDDNTGIGYAAGRSVTTGADNTFLGNRAGQEATTGNNNTLLGHDAGRAGSPFSVTTESNRVVVGDDNVTNAYIEVGWTVTSDARDKTDVAPITRGLDLIARLNPVTFKWDKRSKYWVTDEDGNVINKPTPDGTHKEDQPFAGFLAQEVQQAIQEVGFTEQVIIDTEQPESWKIKETALIPVLVKAVQELSARVKELELKG